MTITAIQPRIRECDLRYMSTKDFVDRSRTMLARDPVEVPALVFGDLRFAFDSVEQVKAFVDIVERHRKRGSGVFIKLTGFKGSDEE